MTTTLLVEPDPIGHHLQAVRSVAQVALRDGDVILLTSAGVSERDEFAVNLADLPIEVRECFPDAEPAVSQVLATLKETCAAQPVSRVVLMDGDNALKTWWFAAWRVLRRLRPRPAIILFLTRWPGNVRNGVRIDPYFLRIRVAKAALVALCRLTRTVDRFAAFSSRDARKPGWLVKRARDPAICEAHSRDRAALRTELGLPSDRELVGIFGGINIRKDPALALDATLRTGPDTDLLLAGPFDEEFAAWLAALPVEQRSRVIARDDFHSNELLDKYLAAADVVLLLMTLEGPSGIMGKALCAEVPVVTANSRTRVRELNSLHCGAAAEATPHDVARALRQVLDSPGWRPRDGALDLPTADAFAETILGPRPADSDALGFR